MNNYKVTLEAIIDKLRYIEEDLTDNTEEEQLGNTEVELDFLDEAYIHLNNSIDSQHISSMKRLTTSRKGLLARIVLYIKNIIRRTVFWFVEPICKDQTHFNEQITQYSIKMFYYLQSDQLKNKIEKDYDERIDDANRKMEKKYIELEDKNKKLEDEIHQIRQQFQKLAIEKNNTNEMFFGWNERVMNRINSLEGKIKECVEDRTCYKELRSFENDSDEETFWIKTTFSQAGEDSILLYVLRVLGVNLCKARYLDLGANHARELSNTYALYQRGMRGVLVEANPDLIPELKNYRNEDIIINKCLADKDCGNMTFYLLNGDGLSCSDLETVNEMIKTNPTLRIEKTIEVPSVTINNLLESYFSLPPTILSIDIEGMEEKILANIDYEKFAPLIIVVERIEYQTSISLEKRNDSIDELLVSKGYREYAYTGINSIYINVSRIRGDF